MDHNALDISSLAAQLGEDGVAFGTDNPVNDIVQRDLKAALIDVASSPAGRSGVVVLEQAGQPAGQLRDLATDVKGLTDLDTVIVRTPASTAAVSDNLSRAQVEKAQYALISEPDYAVGLRAFGEEAGGFAVPWALVAIAALLICFVTAAVSVATSRRLVNG